MGMTLPKSGGPCCRSTVRLSQPAWAMTSAEKELGTCSHPLSTTPSLPQMDLTLFSRTPSPPGLWSHKKTPADETRAEILCRTIPSYRGRVPSSEAGPDVKLPAPKGGEERRAAWMLSPA